PAGSVDCVGVPGYVVSMAPQPPRSTLFPYTTLFRSVRIDDVPHSARGEAVGASRSGACSGEAARAAALRTSPESAVVLGYQCAADRKSTRLNSSHVKISYAVFCWKTKSRTYGSWSTP